MKMKSTSQQQKQTRKSEVYLRLTTDQVKTNIVDFVHF